MQLDNPSQYRATNRYVKDNEPEIRSQSSVKDLSAHEPIVSL